MTRFPIPFFLLASCVAPSSVTPDRFRASASYEYGNTVDVGNVDVGPMTAAYQRFRQLAEGGAKRVTLRIDSFGGSIFLGNRWSKGVEDLKKAHGINVTCIVDGAAYSMAAVILESDVCDLRLATPRSTILFHNGSGGSEGTAAELKSAAGMLEALNAAMALVVSNRIGMPLAEYCARISHGDWVISVAEALHFNVIDGVVSPMQIAPPSAVTL